MELIIENALNHALVTRSLRFKSSRFRNQSDDSKKCSRQVFANHVRSKGVMERHVTRAFSSLLSLSLCVARMCTCCIGDVFWNEKPCKCCRKYSLLALGKLARSTTISKRKFHLSTTPFCRFTIVVTIANICFVYFHSETPDEIHATKR